MNQNRRKILKALGGAGAIAAAEPYLSFPAIAQSRTLKIGIIAPKAGIVGTIGECGLRGTLFAVDRINAAGGIAGRKIELVVEEETNPKDSIERLRKLVLQDKVDCVQGIVSSGVSLAMGAVAEEMKALTIFWDGTTQDGVKETMFNPRYIFRSTDNECEAVMGSLLAIKYWKGKFVTIAGISGVILAGGQGRRMGTVDKGLRELRGKAMVAWVVERFAPQVDRQRALAPVN